MCGIAGIVTPRRGAGAYHQVDRALAAMLAVQVHRGPDGDGSWVEGIAAGNGESDGAGLVALGFRRLAVLDPTPAADQPLADPEGRFHLVLNGEIYNYRELRAELEGTYPFRSTGDTEVLLAAWRRWGPDCLPRLVGMFAFAVWDRQERTLWAARDRFGVKPFHYHRAADGSLTFASEIGALHAAYHASSGPSSGMAGAPPLGPAPEPDPRTWALFLATGLYGPGSYGLDLQGPAAGNGNRDGEASFWTGVRRLPAGCLARLRCGEGGPGELSIGRWYDLAARVPVAPDGRSDREVLEELGTRLDETIALRLRSDVPVGVALSGGLDSSLLFALLLKARGAEDLPPVFTFTTGALDYDEISWVRRVVGAASGGRVDPEKAVFECRLSPEAVPALAAEVQAVQDEPFGGLPTLAYARLFQRARQKGAVVLLDGQGLDEGWAGYDYYHQASQSVGGSSAPLVQGTRESPVRPESLTPELRALLPDRQALGALLAGSGPFGERVRNLQLRDLTRTKIPRVLRFNDRASMRSSVELREPFLDHRLVELGLSQPPTRTVGHGEGKALLRRLAARRLPMGVPEAPKRALQTPQREWLRGPLAPWVRETVDAAFAGPAGDWLDRSTVDRELQAFVSGHGDNSFFVWQWVSLGLLLGDGFRGRRQPGTSPPGPSP